MDKKKKKTQKIHTNLCGSINVVYNYWLREFFILSLAKNCFVHDKKLKIKHIYKNI